MRRSSGPSRSSVAKPCTKDHALAACAACANPGCRSSRRHWHVCQEATVLVIASRGTLHHGDERLPVRSGDVACDLLRDVKAHAFENTARQDLAVWALGNRFRPEVCIYLDQA
jgi:uncharacterized cupin superfamily protein